MIAAKAFTLALKMKLRIAIHHRFQICQGLLHGSVEVKCWCATLFPPHLGLGEMVVGRGELFLVCGIL